MSDTKTLARPDGATPLLFRSASPRTPGPSIPGEYDASASLWVVGDSRRPLVESAATDILEVTTKTKVRQEEDDEDFRLFPVEIRRPASQRAQGVDAADHLELQTKTAVAQEADDEMNSAWHLLELETKTQAEIEHDDQTHLAL